MVELIEEKLFFAAQQNITAIDKTVGAIEKILERLSALRDAEIQRSTAFDGEFRGGIEQTSADAKISSLQKLREELLEEKEKNLLFAKNVGRFLHGKVGYSSGHGMVGVTEDPLEKQAHYCKAAVQRANKALFEVVSIFGEESAAEETSELLRCVENYEKTSCELVVLCYGASDAFRRMRESSLSCNAASSTSIGETVDPPIEASFSCNTASSTNIGKNADPPIVASVSCNAALRTDFGETADPPIQAFLSMPTPPLLLQEENRRQRKDKKTSKNGSKRGLFGFLKGRKKNDLGMTGESVPPPCIDSVRFSAVAPNKVIPGKYLPINIVMYEDAFRKAVDDIIRSHAEGAKESQSGYQDVERNSLIKVVLTSPDVTIEDGEEVQRWTGKYLDFEFVAKIPNDFAEEQILFSAAVYINDLIATRLKLILDCERKPKRNITVTREDIISAFVSYASQDRSRVAAIIQGMKKARPDMDIFFDIETLRSGQNWEEVLRSEISNRDILFLCWSKFARASKWVDMEWRYALESKGDDCIEPIPIDPPEVCPPPVELQQKHFNDRMLYIIKATAQIEGGRPCLIRAKTGECMMINKPLVRIGKQREYVDLFIGDNAAISRHHADIIEREGNYYIVDMNSVNYTYVDGERIPGNVERIIYFGAVIRLADEEFEFTCR